MLNSNELRVDDIRDWHLDVPCSERTAVAFTDKSGAMPLTCSEAPESFRVFARRLAMHISESCGEFIPPKQDVSATQRIRIANGSSMVEVDGRRYRITRLRDGRYSARYSRELMTLEQTGLNLVHRRLMLNVAPPDSTEGGLVLITGEPGSRKTTVVAAGLVERMKAHGGFLMTIEDPIEIEMEGWHGKGYCEQIDASSEGFASAIERALRCFPSGMRGTLFLSEVRNKYAACEALRAARNGYLVVTTQHADSPGGGLQRMVSLARDGGEPDAWMILSQVFRMGLHLSLRGNALSSKALINNDTVRGLMLNGQTQHFAAEVEKQQEMLEKRFGVQR